MGCTPSRGKSIHTAQDPFRWGRTLLPATQESPGESHSDHGASEIYGGGDKDNTTGQKNINSTIIVRKYPSAESENAGCASAKLGTKGINVNILSQPKDKQVVKQEAFEKKGLKKSKKGFKDVKQKKKKEKVSSSVEEKIDFPEPLVKAHHAAYGYLNPSITKYEDLLGLLDHAAKTQISLQPMLTFLALRYEEVNKGLGEIVEEGEKMFQKHRDHLAWPCQKLCFSSSKATNIVTSPTFSEVPPDLLQQLLQYTVQRMRVVSRSVCEIGETALEEAVDYFSSICEILEEKLKTKRTFESRLMQLLSRIEAASQRRPGPEDSTLFSEDSGIGAESESLAGSDRQCQHRESCDSTETTGSRGRLLRTVSNSSSINSIDSTCTITDKGQNDTKVLLGSASWDEGESCEREDVKNLIKKTQLNSSTSDPKQPRRLPAKRIENPQNVEMTLKLKDAISRRIQFLPREDSGVKTKQIDILKSSSDQWNEVGDKSSKRPQTAANRTPKKKTTVTKQCRSRSADSLRCKAEDHTFTELEKTRKELNQRLERMNKCEGKTKREVSKQIQQQQQQTHGISSEGAGRHGPLNKTFFSPSNQRKPGKTKFGEQKVMEDKTTKEKVKDTDKKGETGPVKVIPVPSPPTSPQQSSGGYHGSNSVKKLIDTFSQGMEGSRQMPENTKVLGPLKGVKKFGVPIIPGLSTSVTLAFNVNNTLCCQGESQCSEMTEDLDFDSLPPPPLEVLMDNSFENVQTKNTEENSASRGRSTIPKRTAMTQRLRASLQSVTVLPSKKNFRKGSLSMSPVRTTHKDTRGVGKVGHHDSSHEKDVESELAIDKQERKMYLSHTSDSPPKQLMAEQGQGGVEVSQEENNTNETLPNNVCRDQTPSTPPLSRTRVLPSTPLLHRRLPSPLVFKSQPTSTTLSSPSVVRKLPTPPSTGQWILPVSSPMQHDPKPSEISGVAYPFKAPSPPASPKVQRLSRENSCEDSTSRVFSNARSVFCPASSSLFEAKPVPPPKAPQAWASSGSSVLPRPWGEHVRLPVSARGPQPFIRRSQSDRRPSLSLPPRMPAISVAETCGSEPAISTHGLQDMSIVEEDFDENVFNDPMNSVMGGALKHSQSIDGLPIMGIDETEHDLSTHEDSPDVPSPNDPDEGKYKALELHHSLDMWHGAKNLAKKIAAAAKIKGQSILLNWLKYIVNHFWWCCKTADTREQFMISELQGQILKNRLTCETVMPRRRSLRPDDPRRLGLVPPVPAPSLSELLQTQVRKGLGAFPYSSHKYTMAILAFRQQTHTSTKPAKDCNNALQPIHLPVSGVEVDLTSYSAILKEIPIRRERSLRMLQGMRLHR
ncbi:hypothetical protein E1301_Tti006331 [Triplophysa tibetana]|uniref:Photoreceptor cilium actin regulator n=1 Tax=Triplophysa tibetana TaxID=1572043 RepID=A0A5A9NPF6_9TELE|nr:hypothetical protein E1301_Tti006331 [Triplophysa tibetana]